MNTEKERKRVSLVSSNVILTEDMVSDYLKTHQDFLIRWLTENTTKEIVELFAKKLKDKSLSDASTSSSTVRVSTATGPGQGRLRMASSDPKGTSSLGFPENMRNSITSQIFRRYLDGDRSRKVPVKKDRVSMQTMPEEELFMELIRDIASELDVNMLCHKILQNVSILTNGDRSSLFLVRGSRENKHLVSKLFDVTESSTLEEVMHNEDSEIKVPFGKGIVGIVAQTGKAINIADAYEDPRFNQEIDRLTGYQTHSILCMPIVNFESEVIGVAQIINKITGDHEFTPQDEALFRKYLIFCGIGLTNAQLFEMSVNEFKRNQLLLHLARGIFQEQTNLEKLVQMIMLDAQDLLKCEKCCVYLLEDSCERDTSRFTHAFLSRLGTYSRNTLVLSMQDPAASQKKLPCSTVPDVPKPKDPEDVVFSKAFDLCPKDGTVTVPSPQVLALSRTAFIAKYVVTSGEPVNVEDADMDERFGKGPVLDTSGSRIRSVLCMPIHNSDKNIIGVTQLINKINGQPFNDNDVNIIEAFSIFTGLGIHNCQMYENACQLMAKQSVALEVLSFHATAHAEETNALMNADIPPAQELHLYNFDFNDTVLDDDGTLKACVRMFREADVINTFKVPYDVMCRWLCTVKKNYRPVTYHNWRHAFNVCQTMFAMLFTGELLPLFERLEVFSLLAACLCHDLDHRGTNNAFQAKVASPLAMLYSTSVLEHHHFDHSVMILNSEGNNIFQSLSPDEYRRAIKLVEHAILSTDLALYFKKRGDFKKLVESGERSFTDHSKRTLLRGMMMTACDVSAISKPWQLQQMTAQLVMTEFFEQGDIERQQLGEQPIPMMDRNKKDELPKMQVGFIDAICTPVYKLFALITERLAPMSNGCEDNRRRWQALAEQHQASLDAQKESRQPKAESESAAPQAVPGQSEPEQGLHAQQAVHTDRAESGSQHHQQNQQTSRHQEDIGPRQHQDGPGSNTPDTSGSSSTNNVDDGSHPDRQPQEGQLGTPSSLLTTTTPSSTTTSLSSSSPHPSPPSHDPKAPQPESSPLPSLRNGHRRPWHPDQPSSAQPFPSAHLTLESTAPSSTSCPCPDHTDCGHSCQTQTQTPPVSTTGPAGDWVDPGSSAQEGPQRRHQNGHASAQETAHPEVYDSQTAITPKQTPPQPSPAHRKVKTLAHAQAQALCNSSRNGNKTGVCVIS
ncbi:cGMP-specific 3',5'-cyclic phosphodiesterase-like isoform X2 [Babylonia areolata]|uniref:cGMP-specific 3',5'-cyclic phosphodiesterase-like isoform X2 n=1 Tax=Babylonia areolata TaxID=304850 RepID=UPI003FD4174A